MIHLNRVAEAWGRAFPEPATVTRRSQQALYAVLMIGLVGVVVMVTTLLFLTTSHFGTNLLPWKLYHGGVLEMVYTIIPARRVLRIGLVSFDLLYGGGELQAQEAMATVKVIGRQWYWSYEYSCLPRWESAVSRAGIEPETVRFDAYLLPASEGTKRMLDTDQRVVIPRHASVRVRVTSSDVIHSWRVPRLGVKVDRVPGRLNETIVHLRREGVFYGQCSELCGSGHGFMPIVVEAVSPRSFRMWILGLLQPASDLGPLVKLRVFATSFAESFAKKALLSKASRRKLCFRKLCEESFAKKALRRKLCFRKLCEESFAKKALRRKLCGKKSLSLAGSFGLVPLGWFLFVRSFGLDTKKLCPKGTPRTQKKTNQRGIPGQIPSSSRRKLREAFRRALPRKHERRTAGVPGDADASAGSVCLSSSWFMDRVCCTENL